MGTLSDVCILRPNNSTINSPTSASDTYALAVLVYQLATGMWINGKSAPKTEDAIKRAHLEVTPPAPISLNKEIPDHFSRMLLWALRKKPEDRLKTTTELLSSLALAARFSVDEIPLRADPSTSSAQAAASVTSDILSQWNFLPPPKANLLAQDVPPLEDRMAEIKNVQSQKRGVRIGVMSVFIFVMVAGIISLFWFVRPAPVSTIPTPVQFTPFASDYTPPPTLHRAPQTHRPTRRADCLHLHARRLQPTLHDQSRWQRTHSTFRHGSE